MPEQHPIPQQISSYQFRLVGDMTLTQFFQLAGGAVVSLIFYASNLHPAIKWPAVILFALLGVAIAFLPIEERSLDKWFISFVKSIYSPTLFYWKSEPDRVFFSKDTGTLPPMTAPHGIRKAEEYLKKPIADSKQEQHLDSTENQYLEGIKTQLTGQPLDHSQSVEEKTTFTQSPPAPQAHEQVLEASQTASAKQEASFPPTPLNTINIPKMDHVQVVPSVVENPQFQHTVIKKEETPVYSAQAQKTLDSVSVKNKDTSPLPPEKPNTLVGQVLDENGDPVESAILEMRDENKRPVRALRSNKLGHFLVVTALADGTYKILTEKEGYEFDPISIEMKGEIVPSITINGRRVKS